VVVPEIQEWVFWAIPRFCEHFSDSGIGACSRNSGISDLRQIEILWSFQKFRNNVLGHTEIL
jgi:hypothetical protein